MPPERSDGVVHVSSTFTMVLSPYKPCPLILTNPAPENHLSWSETPESHIYSADLPGT